MKDLNILIIEDETLIYMHIKQTLKTLGLDNIHIARDSKSAIKITSDIKIDLAFCDVKIDGEVDGIDTIKYLQNIYTLPVIFITAYRDKNTLNRISKIDYVGFLLKPYRVLELEACLNLAIFKYNLLENINKISYKDYYLDKNNLNFYENNIQIKLSKKEQLFICLLFHNFDTILLYSVIDSTIWHDCVVSDNTRRTFFYRFRNKFEGLDIRIEKNIGIGLFKS